MRGGGRTRPPWASKKNWRRIRVWAMIYGWDRIDLPLVEQLDSLVRKTHPEMTAEQRVRLVELAWGIHLEHVKSRGDGH